MECDDIDGLLASIRSKVVRGSKPTRQRRLLGSLRTIDTSNPTKARDVGMTESAVRHREENTESSMNLSDAIQNFRSIAEANITAPAADKSGPDGKKQISSKSKFDNYGGADKDYKREKASIPSDKEAMGPGTNTTQGVSGPGYNGSGREKVDVRYESATEALRSDARSGIGVANTFGFVDETGDVDFAEAMLRDEIGRMNRVQEANIQAPAQGIDLPGGGKQIAPKSGFRKGYAGPDKDYKREKVSIPADKEAMQGDTNTNQGVEGPGYTADGREEVDVRAE